MTLHPTTPRRERILAFGPSNSGRSSTWLNIAQMAAQFETDTHLYVGGTDRAWDAMRYDEIEPYVSYEDLDRNDFMPWIDWAKNVKAKVRPDDWVVVDMADVAWDAAQEHVLPQVTNTGSDMLADIYLANLKAIESKGGEGEFMGGAHGQRWDIIKRYYFAFMQTATNCPCHLLFVCDAKEIRVDMIHADVKKAQWKVGWMPRGQADLPKQFHTWLFCAETGNGWVYTTIRDKVPLGREPRVLLKGAKVTNGLVLDYLLPIAGWTL